MIDFSLAREIYGMSPWFVDQETLPSLLAILNNNIQLDTPEVKLNSPGIFVLNETRVIDRPYGNSWNPGQLDNKENFTGIAVINLNGPITVSGGASSMGMEQLSLHMQTMAADKRIVSFIILGNSGGGSSAAVEIMTETISEIDKTKPVYGLVKKGGVAASACYGIMSACREIYAESPMSMVGSAGTMVQFEGYAANAEIDGKKHKRIYATKSISKNKDFEEALNNDNHKLIINNLLDPVNERFLQLIESNRPILKGTDFDTGKTVFAKDAVGSFIDGIKSFAEVVKIASSTAKNPTSGHNKSINTNMNAEQLKQDHPETYNSIFKAGATSEKNRVSAWMAYAESDLNTVKEGVLGVETVDSKREELLIKSYASNHVKNLEKDSPPTITTAASGAAPEKSDDEKEMDALNAEVDNLLTEK